MTGRGVVAVLVEVERNDGARVGGESSFVMRGSEEETTEECVWDWYFDEAKECVSGDASGAVKALFRRPRTGGRRQGQFHKMSAIQFEKFPNSFLA